MAPQGIEFLLFTFSSFLQKMEASHRQAHAPCKARLNKKRKRTKNWFNYYTGTEDHGGLQSSGTNLIWFNSHAHPSFNSIKQWYRHRLWNNKCYRNKTSLTVLSWHQDLMFKCKVPEKPAANRKTRENVEMMVNNCASKFRNGHPLEA